MTDMYIKYLMAANNVKLETIFSNDLDYFLNTISYIYYLIYSLFLIIKSLLY